MLPPGLVDADGSSAVASQAGRLAYGRALALSRARSDVVRGVVLAGR